ncbi:MAG TPA: universal stress protein [Blastocatellia bacterium]|nr:universal stress protein [Blastocatellia bacterium]
MRVLIGVDGSNGGAEAARVAAGREWPKGTEIRFVAVYDPVTPTMAGLVIPKVVHWVDGENRATIQLALKMVESLERQFRSNKLSTSHLVVAGEPKRVLLDEAHRWRAGCIFVGARGLSRINRFLLGSVSAAVAARAHCSVEVIRSTERASGLQEFTDCGDYA